MLEYRKKHGERVSTVPNETMGRKRRREGERERKREREMREKFPACADIRGKYLPWRWC